MPEPRTCHLPNRTVLVCIDRLGQTEALQRHSTDIVASEITEMGVGDE